METAQDDEEVDETGINRKDIVMTQASVPRSDQLIVTVVGSIASLLVMSFYVAVAELLAVDFLGIFNRRG